jgi:hypothetical protein
MSAPALQGSSECSRHALRQVMRFDTTLNDAGDGLIFEPLRADVAAFAYWTQHRQGGAEAPF